MSNNDPESDQNKIAQAGAYITLPFVLAVPPVIGWWIGSWLDKTFDTSPYFMYILMVLGFVAGFRELYRIVKRFGGEI